MFSFSPSILLVFRSRFAAVSPTSYITLQTVIQTSSVKVFAAALFRPGSPFLAMPFGEEQKETTQFGLWRLIIYLLQTVIQTSLIRVSQRPLLASHLRFWPCSVGKSRHGQHVCDVWLFIRWSQKKKKGIGVWICHQDLISSISTSDFHPFATWGRNTWDQLPLLSPSLFNNSSEGTRGRRKRKSKLREGESATGCD